MCHSIAKVKSTMGQADFYLEYPKLHELAATKNPVMRALHDFVIRLNPEPHRRVFLKPFMRTQTAEFCSTCHKVHLDVPVNHYRWVRGFNEYDNWQASGVSGAGCAIVLLSAEAAAVRRLPHADDRFERCGKHRRIRAFASFSRARTPPCPPPTRMQTQLKLTEEFLKSGVVTVDIFAFSVGRRRR